MTQTLIGEVYIAVTHDTRDDRYFLFRIISLKCIRSSYPIINLERTAMEDCILGMEFSGRDEQGKRVMGLVPTKVSVISQ